MGATDGDDRAGMRGRVCAAAGMPGREPPAPDHVPGTTRRHGVLLACAHVSCVDVRATPSAHRHAPVQVGKLCIAGQYLKWMFPSF